MKVLIDLSFIRNADLSIGFSRVSVLLVSSFLKLRSFDDFILLIDNSSKDYFTARFSKCRIFSFNFKTVFWGSLHFWILKRKISKIINDYKIGLFFCPFISARSVLPRNLNAIGILHDVQKLKIVSDSFLVALAYKYFMFFQISRFDQIITISNSEKKHILDMIPKLFNKIQVVHNGVETCAFTKKVKEVPQNCKYILDINTLFEYKNALTLIKAFEIIKDEIPHILILKGKITSYWSEVLQPYIVEHNLQTRVILIDRILEDSEVAYLYQNADVFVSPSLMEGFGLTPVEAAIYGTPVICSDIDTLREATMELVDYFSPMDYQQLSCILKLKLQKKDKAKLQSISKKLSSEYSLLEQAKRFLKIFDEYENNNSNTSI